MDAGGPMKGEESADTAAFDRLANMDDMLSYLRSLMSDRLLSFILNYNLCSEGDKWL